MFGEKDLLIFGQVHNMVLFYELPILDVVSMHFHGVFIELFHKLPFVDLTFSNPHSLSV